MLTSEQITALAPDPASAQAGRGLANRRKWLSAARSGDLSIWGECQGSGSKPYQTAVDLSEPAFKCSCPSRKFPCKHGLGLLLLFAADASAFAEADPPDWVSAWLVSRIERAEKQAAKKADDVEQVPDPVAQARRIAQREARVLSGIDDLDRWLRDLMRRGLANVDLGYKFWDAAAARLVDSQAPGLARMLREMSGIPSSGQGWQDRLVEKLGLLYLAVQGYKRLSTLPEGAQADLRSTVGWTYSQEEVLAGDSVSDRWTVLAQHVEEDDRLQVQRSWLLGNRTGRPALILQFAHGSQSFENTLVAGTAFDGDVAFFPSAYPLRALIKSRDAQSSAAEIAGSPSISTAIDAYGRAIAKLPWLDRYPAALSSVTPFRTHTGWEVVDRDSATLPISPRFARGWHILALSGGRPATVCGEWNGTHLLPLGIFVEGRYSSLT